MTRSTLFLWTLRLLAAIILLQTLFFKFTAAEESVFIFTKMGIEPWGRITTGIAELITTLFILYRPMLFIGAILGVGIMTGALLSHIVVLGIEIQQDGGQLFIYAAVVWISCLILSIMNRQDLPNLLERIKSRNVKGK